MKEEEEQMSGVDELRFLVDNVPDGLLAEAARVVCGLPEARDRHELLFRVVENLVEPDAQQQLLEQLMGSLRLHGEPADNGIIWLRIAARFPAQRSAAALAALDCFEQAESPPGTIVKPLIRVLKQRPGRGGLKDVAGRLATLRDRMVEIDERVDVSIALAEAWDGDEAFVADALRELVQLPLEAHGDLVMRLASVAPASLADVLLDLAWRLAPRDRTRVFERLAEHTGFDVPWLVLDAAYESSDDGVVRKTIDRLSKTSPDRLLDWLFDHQRVARFVPILAMRASLAADRLRPLAALARSADSAYFRFRCLIAVASREDAITHAERVELVKDSVGHSLVHPAIAEFVTSECEPLSKEIARLAEGAMGLATQLEEPGGFLFRILRATLADAPSDLSDRWVKCFQDVAEKELQADYLPVLLASAPSRSALAIVRAVIALPQTSRAEVLARCTARLVPASATWALINLPPDAAVNELLTLFAIAQDEGQIYAWERFARWNDASVAAHAKRSAVAKFRPTAAAAILAAERARSSESFVWLFATLTPAAWGPGVARVFVDGIEAFDIDTTLANWQRVVEYLSQVDVEHALSVVKRHAQHLEPAVQASLVLPLARRLGQGAVSNEAIRLHSLASTSESREALAVVVALVAPAALDNMSPLLDANQLTSSLATRDYLEVARQIQRNGADTFVRELAAGIPAPLEASPRADAFVRELAAGGPAPLEAPAEFEPPARASLLHELGSAPLTAYSASASPQLYYQQLRLSQARVMSLDSAEPPLARRPAASVYRDESPRSVEAFRARLNRLGATLEPDRVALNAWFENGAGTTLVEGRAELLAVTVGAVSAKSILAPVQASWVEVALSPLVTFQFIVQCPGCNVRPIKPSYAYGSDEPAMFELSPEPGSRGQRNLVIVVLRDGTTVHVSNVLLTIEVSPVELSPGGDPPGAEVSL